MSKAKISTTLLFVSTFCFWAFIKPEWLNFHEQYQLFLFSTSYLTQHLALPGGIAIYLGEFLVQFFYNTYLGAMVAASTITTIYIILQKISNCYCNNQNTSSLQLLAPILILVYSGDENMLFTFPTAILLSLIMSLIYIKKFKTNIWLQFLFFPLIYWLIGYCVWIYVFTTTIYLIKKESNNYKTMAISGIQMLGLVFFMFWIAYFPIKNYPMCDIFMGIDYHRERMKIPFWQHIIAIICIITPPITTLLTKAKNIFFYTSISAITIIGILGVIKNYNPNIYSHIKLDYYVRWQKWNDILNYATKNNLNNVFANTAVNLALSQTNQMPDRLFEFKQNGNEGFLSNFEYNSFSTGPTAEACYYLGMINSTLRYNFDMQSAILNSKNSGRFFKRIAEAYLLNGNYDVADRYLRKLKQTLFYRSWAIETQNCLSDENKIMQNPEWARIKMFKYNKGLNFSTNNLPKVLITLHEHCPENKMALDYALSSCLVNKNLEEFIRLFPFYTKSYGTTNIPKIYQQAFAIACFQNNYTIDNMPSFISQEVKNDFIEFDNAYLINPKSKILTTGKFSNSFWKYYMEVGN